MRKMYLRVLILVIATSAIAAVSSSRCFGQNGITIEVQNAGTPIGTFKKWLPINCSTNLTCTMSGGVVTMSASGVAGPSFNCASTQYANLKACLDAAKTYVGSSNAGSDNAAYIYLPSGTLSLSGTPYTLTGGMQIMGVAPRVEYIAGTSADLNMIPDGGTWIDCGGNQCFTGTGIRGLSITNVGFQDFCTSGTSGCSVFTFGNGNGGTGGAGVDGVAWSTFSNLIAIGHTCSSGLSGCYSDQAWVFYNSQHIHGDFMTAFNTNVGLNLISQGPEEPMNSVFSDIYTYTYAKSSANGNSSKPGLWLQCLTDGAGNTSGLAFITIIRPQVNSYNGDGTGYNIIANSVAAGAVEDIELLDVDAEGPQLDQIYLNGLEHSHIRYMGYSGSPSPPTTTVEVTTTSNFNTIESEDNNAILKIDSGGNAQNFFYGAWLNYSDASTSKRGQIWQSTPNQGVWDYNDYGWYAQGLTFGNYSGTPGQLTSAGAFLGYGSGSATTPAYGIVGDVETGMVGYGSGTVGFSSAGTLVWSYNGSLLATEKPLYIETSQLGTSSTNACLETGSSPYTTFSIISSCSSLRKYKSRIRRLDLALPEVLKLKPVSYTWKSTGKRELGFIAEDIEKLDPRLSTYDGDGSLRGVQYGHMVALLTKAIQEQQEEILELQNKVKALGTAK